MADKTELALKGFSAPVMLDNIDHLKSIISRIRQKEGGVGSEEDEMCLHRVLHDLDLLVDIADGLKAACDDLDAKHRVTCEELTTTQQATDAMKEAYERLVTKRDKRISALEEQLDESGRV